MARPNEAVAALLQEYADLLSITGGEDYKVRSYERAARAVAGHHTDVSALDLAGLRQIPQVGTSIAEKIIEYLHSGQVAAVEQARAAVPAGVRELTAIPTLGPKKAMVLYQERGVSSVAELAAAIDQERLAGLRGFGPKTVENLRHGIDLLRRGGGRVLVSAAMSVAEEVVAALSAVPGCVECAYAGSLRRVRDSIGDVDVLAAGSGAAAPRLADAFVNLPQVAEVIAHGPTRSSVRTSAGLQVDLRVVEPAAWGAALLYFTGSRAHNIRVREIAARHGWKLLHTHTDLTDGVAPLAEMVSAARARGYRYYAPDHPADRPAGPDRRRLRRGVRGRGAHRHRDRDQQLPGPPGPAGRADPAGEAGRGPVRGGHRRALHRAPRLSAVRDRDRATGMAHRRRCDKHLAAGEAAPVRPRQTRPRLIGEDAVSLPGGTAIT